VFRDHKPAAHLRTVDSRIETDNDQEGARSIAQAIRARDETTPAEPALPQ
jgi:hypothetical protein